MTHPVFHTQNTFQTYVLFPKAIKVLPLFFWTQRQPPCSLSVLKTAGCKPPASKVNAPCLKVVMQQWKQASKFLRIC